MIPIFDSNAHPTLTERWPDKSLDASFSRLEKELKESQFRGACAVGVAGLENYQHKAFIEKCKQVPTLIPVAGFSLKSEAEMLRELKLIKKIGYRAVKIHPRDPKIKLQDKRLVSFLKTAGKLELPVYFCTYSHAALEDYPESDPFYDLVAILKKAPKTKVILVHGGDVRVLLYSELVRFNFNLLLDLSFTFMKYQGSSIDQDIRYLFERFDRRICIGTDYPEFSHAAVRSRFEFFSKGITVDKLENIAYRNIEEFLKK